jgi:glycerol-3-phosphate acyltransferase PlsY
VVAWFLADEGAALVSLFLAVLVVARHHGNIRRLLRGEETPIRLKRDRAAAAG